VADRDLTWKEKSFVQYFANQDFQNATQAAVLAGYAPKSAHVAASRLLNGAKVSAAIEQAQEDRAKRLVLSTDRTLTEVLRIAYGDVTELFEEVGDVIRLKPFSELTRDQRALIASIEQTVDTIDQGKGNPVVIRTKTKVHVNDKLQALTLLMRHQNLLPTTAKSMVINNDNRTLSVTMQALLAGLSTEDLRATLEALRGPDG
jgi:phage terminase small subunit